MDIVTRQKLIVLIQLAKADHEFVASEKEVIEQIASRHSFPESELQELLEGSESIESLGALSPLRKREYLVDCLHVIMADGKIEPQEITFAQNIAVKLGYHKDVVTRALDQWPKIDQVDVDSWRLA